VNVRSEFAAEAYKSIVYLHQSSSTGEQSIWKDSNKFYDLVNKSMIRSKTGQISYDELEIIHIYNEIGN